MSHTWQPPRGLDAPHPSSNRVITADRAFLATGPDVVVDAAVVVTDGFIRWVGERAAVPAQYADLPVQAHPGATILPGLIETHAHLGSYDSAFPLTTPDPQFHARSLAAIRRLGAQPEGVLRGHRVAFDGTRSDTAYFSFLRDEGPAARAGLEGRLAQLGRPTA